jgi:hypothetical protein
MNARAEYTRARVCCVCVCVCSVCACVCVCMCMCVFMYVCRREGGCVYIEQDRKKAKICNNEERNARPFSLSNIVRYFFSFFFSLKVREWYRKIHRTSL